jgi:hypothetical protein
MTLTPPQWPHLDEIQRHVRRGRGWAMTEHHPSTLVAAAMDQSKLLKDDSGPLPRKDVGRDGPHQSNDDDGRCRMGGGTTRTTP